MKKLAVILILCTLTLCSINTLAQVRYKTYYCSYVNKNYNIDLDTSRRVLYIDGMSLDRLHDKGGIILYKDQLPGFIESMNIAKNKYIEWVKTAKENNVTELNKKIATSAVSAGYFKYGKDWEFAFDINLTFSFQIIQTNGEVAHLLVIKTGELKSSSNEYMTVDGFLLIFSSVTEINNFMNSISPENITNFLNKPKAADLFKD